MAEGPGYIGGNQQSSLTWEHQLELSPSRNKQRGLSLTKNIWSSSCFILRSLHGISCSQANLHLFSHRNHWRKSMWWLPKRIPLGKYLLLQWLRLLIIEIQQSKKKNPKYITVVITLAHASVAAVKQTTLFIEFQRWNSPYRRLGEFWNWYFKRGLLCKIHFYELFEHWCVSSV